jgi:hypothetical protein
MFVFLTLSLLCQTTQRKIACYSYNIDETMKNDYFDYKQLLFWSIDYYCTHLISSIYHTLFECILPCVLICSLYDFFLSFKVLIFDCNRHGTDFRQSQLYPSVGLALLCTNTGRVKWRFSSFPCWKRPQLTFRALFQARTCILVELPKTYRKLVWKASWHEQFQVPGGIRTHNNDGLM